MSGQAATISSWTAGEYGFAPTTRISVLLVKQPNEGFAQQPILGQEENSNNLLRIHQILSKMQTCGADGIRS